MRQLILRTARVLCHRPCGLVGRVRWVRVAFWRHQIDAANLAPGLARPVGRLPTTPMSPRPQGHLCHPTQLSTRLLRSCRHLATCLRRLNRQSRTLTRFRRFLRRKTTTMTLTRASTASCPLAMFLAAHCSQLLSVQRPISRINSVKIQVHLHLTVLSRITRRRLRGPHRMQAVALARETTVLPPRRLLRAPARLPRSANATRSRGKARLRRRRKRRQ